MFLLNFVIALITLLRCWELWYAGVSIMHLCQSVQFILAICCSSCVYFYWDI